MTGGYRKIKLFSLMVALIVAGLAVVGGTWATGALYEGEGKTVNGDYDVPLTYYDGENYVTTIGDQVNYFGNGLWCPGKTQIVYLKVNNNEDFAVNATVNLNIGESEFAEGVMEYAFYVADSSLHDETSKPSNWSEFKTRAGNATGQITAGTSYTLLNQYSLANKNAAQYIALAIHMNENAANDNQNKKMQVGFSIQVDSLFRPDGTTETPDSSNEESGNS